MLSKYSNNPAAITATNMLRTFSAVRDIVMVGIAAGVPRPHRHDQHVRLGDVVVSSGAGVVQFDLGAETEDGFHLRGYHPPPSARLLQAVHLLKSDLNMGNFDWQKYLAAFLQKSRINRPKKEPIRSFRHPRDPGRIADVPKIYEGKIGASNTLLKRAKRRDELANKHGLLAFEMEGSGIADASWEGGVGYLIIRGTCDYGDKNKGDVWQNYAAAVSAAYLGAMLTRLPPVEEPVHPQAAHDREKSKVSLPRLRKELQLSNKRLTSCAWSSDSNHIYSAGFDGILYGVNGVSTNAKTTTICPSIIRVVRSLPGISSLLVGDDRGRLFGVDTISGNVTEMAMCNTSIFAISPGTMTNKFFMADREGVVTEWQLRQAAAKRQTALTAVLLRTMHDHSGPAFAVQWDEWQNRIISVGSDGYVRWTALTRDEKASMRISDHALFALVAARDQALLALGSQDGSIIILRGSHKKVLEGHSDAVRSLSLSPHGTWLVSGSKDATIRLWNFASGQTWILAHVHDYVYDVVFSPVGSQIAAVDGTGMLITFEFPQPIDELTPSDIDRLWNTVE
jgi:nucleoside phosphorylase